MSNVEPRRDRVQRARRFARFEIGVAIVWILFGVLLFVAAPGFTSPMFSPVPSQAISAGAFTIQVVALAVMIHIYRARPETGDRTWRYRDF